MDWNLESLCKTRVGEVEVRRQLQVCNLWSLVGSEEHCFGSEEHWAIMNIACEISSSFFRAWEPGLLWWGLLRLLFPAVGARSAREERWGAYGAREPRRLGADYHKFRITKSKNDSAAS